MKIGIIGAGQLGRMLALAGYPLGLKFLFLDTSDQSPGGQIGDIVIGALDDRDGIARVAGDCDVVTVDVENVPADALAAVADRTTLWPPVRALETAQDRLSEKTLFGELGIPTPAFRVVDDVGSLRSAAAELGLPAVLKTRRLGYDGRGQVMLSEGDDLAKAHERLGGLPMILEEKVPFDFEVSLIGARAADGRTAYYPLSHNTHHDGILRVSRAPYEDDGLEAQARNHVGRILEAFRYVGVLTVEFFVAGGRLLANEIAPRVHNSGHWTIEGAVTSQFENHVRAIAGLPLGDTSVTGHSAMVNFLGEMPARDAVLAIDRAHYHDYGKAPRPMRKLGHGTVVCPTAAERDDRLARLLATMEP